MLGKKSARVFPSWDLVLLTVYVTAKISSSQIFHPLTKSFQQCVTWYYKLHTLFLGDVMDLVLLTVYVTAKISSSQIFHPLTEEFPAIDLGRMANLK
jgi:hypothetical protein